MTADKTECNRWLYADLDEKCPQKFDVWDFVPASGVYHSSRLTSLGNRLSIFSCE